MQSAPEFRPKSFTVLNAVSDCREEIAPLLRRRWSAEAKARILEQAMAPGANISAVARAHGLSPQQIFAWRRKAIRSGAITLLPIGAEAEAQSFSRVELAGEDSGGAGELDIVIRDTTIRFGPAASLALLIKAIRAVRSA